MFIICHRGIFYWITGILFVLSVLAIAYFGLAFSIDFTGGSLTEVTYPAGRPEKVEVESALQNLALGNVSVLPAGESAYLIRTRDLSEPEHQALLTAASLNGSVASEETRFSSIGPVIGQEFARKALVSLLLISLAIIALLAFTFRKVSKPVASWKYGVIVVVALLHDVLIPLGIFAVLGHYFHAEIDVLFVVAILAILGYSVNDTIVVFDRVRENLKNNEEKHIHESFEETVGKSLTQTIGRSINTSVTTLLAITALLFIGDRVTQYFALTLFTGIVAGTFSSIAFAAPLLVTWEKWQREGFGLRYKKTSEG